MVLTEAETAIELFNTSKGRSIATFAREADARKSQNRAAVLWTFRDGSRLCTRGRGNRFKVWIPK
jgi:hypothetical protein